MKLLFSVLTMVTRDDLVDGGAAHIAQTVQAIRHMCPGVDIELLISDLAGSNAALETVLAASPQVLSHNLETVPRLYPKVRPQANYRRSLHLLNRAAAYSPSIVAKSGLMLGLGETTTEVYTAMDDLRAAGCRLITLGQYLSPSENHHPVIRFIPPEQFEEYRQGAIERGFSGVASAPLVRSSYRAAELYRSARHPHRS
jgi:lipoic acid synthetase